MIFCDKVNAAPDITDQSIINQQDWITRQQQNKIEEEKRIKEQDAIKKEQDRKEKKDEGNQKQLPITGKPAECFPIKLITLNGAELLSKRQQKKITLPFLGKCVEPKILVELVTTINNYYHEKGYVAAKVNIPKQNIQSGNLELKILEGKLMR